MNNNLWNNISDNIVKNVTSVLQVPEVIELNNLSLSTVLTRHNAELLSILTQESDHFLTKSAENLQSWADTYGVRTVVDQTSGDLLAHLGVMPFVYGDTTIFERSTLWVDPVLRGTGVSDYLVKSINEQFVDAPIISITSVSSVKKKNIAAWFVELDRDDIWWTALHDALKIYGWGKWASDSGWKVYMNHTMKALFEEVDG